MARKRASGGELYKALGDYPVLLTTYCMVATRNSVLGGSKIVALLHVCFSLLSYPPI